MFIRKCYTMPLISCVLLYLLYSEFNQNKKKFKTVKQIVQIKKK